MTEQRGAYLRIQQYYGEILADFHRRQADIAAEHEAKLAGWRHVRQAEPSEEPSAAACEGTTAFDCGAFDEDDFSNNTWLR